jgi:hypothetical protein
MVNAMMVNCKSVNGKCNYEIVRDKGLACKHQWERDIERYKSRNKCG